MIIEQCIGFLNTPPLWMNEQFGIQQFVFPKIDLRSLKPSPVPSKIRLGHQMEHVFKQLIEYDTTYEVIVHNMPIRNGKQTIGEIDFILKAVATKVVVHVELTYKFYLVTSEITEPIHQLIGPNKRDAFFAKMKKIKNRQFALLHTVQGIRALDEIDIDHKEIVHKTCFKAQLFVPYGFDHLALTSFNNDCIIGYWLNFDDLNSATFESFKFYIPYKSQWVMAPHKNVQWDSHFKILTDINLSLVKEKAPMVWMRISETVFEKFFVVWW